MASFPKLKDVIAAKITVRMTFELIALSTGAMIWPEGQIWPAVQLYLAREAILNHY